MSALAGLLLLAAIIGLAVLLGRARERSLIAAESREADARARERLDAERQRRTVAVGQVGDALAPSSDPSATVRIGARWGRVRTLREGDDRDPS